MTTKRKTKVKPTPEVERIGKGQDSGCVVISAGGKHSSIQGLPSFTGISTETADSQGISMHIVTIPPGGRASAHRHESHETAIYVISGEVEVWCGKGLQDQIVVRAGEFLYIPASTPHLPINWSDTESCVSVLARTDPNEQESVVLMPELDELPNLVRRA